VLDPKPDLGLEILKSRLDKLDVTVQQNSKTIGELPSVGQYQEIVARLDEVKVLLGKQQELGRRLWSEQLVVLALLIGSWLVTLTLLFKVLRLI
jgi:hypothetical protein